MNHSCHWAYTGRSNASNQRQSCFARRTTCGWYIKGYISFTNNEIVMPPVLFASPTFPDLLLLDGDQEA
jgi:hypothetical protein